MSICMSTSLSVCLLVYLLYVYPMSICMSTCLSVVYPRYGYHIVIIFCYRYLINNSPETTQNTTTINPAHSRGNVTLWVFVDVSAFHGPPAPPDHGARDQIDCAVNHCRDYGKRSGQYGCRCLSNQQHLKHCRA